jgi:WD40 repeat protein
MYVRKIVLRVWTTGQGSFLLQSHPERYHQPTVQIWALAVSSDERTVVTAAADSVITFWVDSTEEELLEKAAKQAELVSMCVTT